MDFADNWSDSPPDQFDRTQAVPQFKQYIFEHWKRGEGPCSDCPNHFRKKKCFPAFGNGKAKAEIILVGSSPGPRDRAELEIDKKNRAVDPVKLEDHPDFDGFPLTSFNDYTIDDLNTWNGFRTLRKRFIEDSNGLDTKLENNTIYFTNAKKCVNIENRDNEEALGRCSNYLEKEIAIIDPSVVISWGMQGAKGTAQALKYDMQKLPKKPTSLPPGDVQPTNSCLGYRKTADQYPSFISMPHFSMLGSNARHIPGFDPSKHENPEIHLYYELANLVKYLQQ